MENIGWQHCVLFVAKLCTFLLQNTSVLNLSKKHSNEALEKACQIALERLHSPRYRQLNTILNNPNNKEILEEAESAQKETLGFVRGPEYYGGDIND